MTIVPIKPVELMNGEFSDFIGVWKDHVPKIICDKAIKHIDDILENASYNNGKTEHFIMEGDQQFPSKNLGRKDYSLILNHSDGLLNHELMQYLHACFLDYLNEYGQLQNSSMVSTESKLQRTEPEGGYHVWHYEDAGYEFAQRVLVWMIYLNDVPEGEGETEFLYQRRRIPPKAGTCVIWPASYTHVHRGNPVYSQNKYILTGWYHNLPTIMRPS